MPKTFGLAVHGGAGMILRETLPLALEAEYRAALQGALDVGQSILATGGGAMDAVVAALVLLEDDPLFNAGRGSALNAEGLCELDAAIMDGRTLSAGAVAGLRHTRNPIRVARDVIDHSPHVLLVGEGAERFARDQDHPRVPNEFFQTTRRRRQLEEVRRSAAHLPAHRSPPELDDNRAVLPLAEYKWGTVGCVALDATGHLAAGTSTGGMTNKKYGRVGDSPIIGAGTYAENATCAVSATGHGEYFIRAGFARDVAARMAYAGKSISEAASAALHRIGALGGSGGAIALDAAGRLATPFNTPGMYRGWWFSDGRASVAIFPDGDEAVPRSVGFDSAGARPKVP
jgi:beta-aspartyl-peptidase (threonine type)